MSKKEKTSTGFELIREASENILSMLTGQDPVVLQLQELRAKIEPTVKIPGQHYN